MFHIVARAAHGQVLFRDWTEARALWERVVPAVVGLSSAALMPDHVHLKGRSVDEHVVSEAMRSYALWRHGHRGERGRVWDPVEKPERIPDASKDQRTDRYIELNPCRWPHLVSDPLAWPFSTHRDAVGLAADPVRAPRADPAGWHRYVSSDPDVDVAGTPLPRPMGSRPTLEQLRDAVSAVTRTPLPGLARRGPARALIVRCALAAGYDAAAIAAFSGLQAAAVRRAPRGDERDVAVVQAVAGDPRFAALDDDDLRPGWPATYRYRR